MPSYVLTLSCPDRPGIVHAVTGALLSVGGNITESAQFDDIENGWFVLRTAFDAPVPDADVVATAVRAEPALDGAEIEVRAESDLCRVLIMVSKFDHCLVDLLYRWHAGDLPVDVVGVVSNHDDCRPIAERYGVAYHLLPVTAHTKPQAEAKLLQLVDQTHADLVVLARYMQVLSDSTCEALRGRAINIHHSFLPGFKGARPYHQAHTRGVKLIGATAHYVTSDLDEGPIIEQDVVRVGHVETPERLAAVGRDVERRVLAEAVRRHAERRIFISGTRTVVF